MSSFPSPGGSPLTLLQPRDLGYPEQVWYALAAFLFVVGTFQWGSSVHTRFARHQHPKSDEETTANRNRNYSLRRVPLAFINFYRIVAFRWTLEIGQTYILNMAEVFVTLAYIALLVTYSCINSSSIDGQALGTAFWHTRVAVIATSQLPILTVLGTKNNLVSLVTGISYEKLNYVHRMMARVCFVLLWIHGISEAFSYPDFKSTLREGWLRVGIAAMVAFSILIIVSLRPIRSEAYELFFYTHFIGVLIFLIGGYYHTYAHSLSVWIWPSFVLWAFDRLIRIVRLVLFNRSYFGFKSGSGTMDATAELLSEHVVRLRLYRPPYFHWSPGQSVYLTMPSVSTLPFEAHPFTIASVDSRLFQTIAPEFPSQSDVKEEVQLSAPSTPLRNELVFLINVREGFTKKLKAVAAEKGKVKVFIDGPYGPSPDFRSDDTCILVAGGSGVSHTLPIFLSVIERVRKDESSCRRLVFIWSIHDTAHAQWIDETLIKAVQLAPPSLTVSIRIFVTGAEAVTQFNLSAKLNSTFSRPAEKKNVQEPVVAQGDLLPSPLFSLGGVKMKHGRPNLSVLLNDEISAASGTMSVNVCGSRGITDAVRHALRFSECGPRNILSGGPSVTLHVQSFGYA